jgi:hypothetical protein
VHAGFAPWLAAADERITVRVLSSACAPAFHNRRRNARKKIEAPKRNQQSQRRNVKSAGSLSLLSMVF